MSSDGQQVKSSSATYKGADVAGKDADKSYTNVVATYKGADVAGKDADKSYTNVVATYKGADVGGKDADTAHRKCRGRVVLCVLAAIVLVIGLMPTVPLSQSAWANVAADATADTIADVSANIAENTAERTTADSSLDVADDIVCELTGDAGTTADATVSSTVSTTADATVSSTVSTAADATVSSTAGTTADADSSGARAQGAQAADENGRTEVIIGDPENDSTSNMVPFASWTDLATMATLYTADEIGQEGDIASLSFYVASAAQTSVETSLDIYVCMTDLTTFPSSTGSLFEEGDLTLVYSNDSVVMGQEVGWETWEFDETFYYDGMSNLIVVTAHSQEESPGDYTYAYTTINSAIRTTYRANSANSSNPWRYTDPYYSGIYWMPGNHGNKRADMRLTFGDKLTSDLFEVDTSSETYTGEEITKAITTDLVEDVDYHVEYSNNVNAGEATITITGLGTYVGTLTYTFDILPASILNADISGIESSYVYTGEEIVPEPTVTLNGRTLHRGTDYHVIYNNNIDVGTASVTISAIDNYTDSVTISFEIVKPEPVTCTVVFDSQGGSPVEPQAVVKGQCAEEPPEPSRDGFAFTGWFVDKDCTQLFDFAEPITDDITLYAGWDAESDPSPEPNPDPTPEPDPEPTPDPDPTPTVTKITQDMFIVDTSSAIYTGLPIEKAVASPLTNGVDYEVTYENNTNVGSATITITGIGDYAGTLTYTFDITRAFVRLAGDDRYGTMEEIDDEGFTSADTVVLTTGANFPDALAAAGLAGTLDAPVLLTDAAALSAETAEEIARLGTMHVIIVGGEASVSAAVVQELTAMGVSVERIAGSDRYATAVEAYYAGQGDWGMSGNGTAKTAIIAAGGSFADTLSASSYAWWASAPIFLASADGLDEATMTAIKTGGFERVVIVGGTASVPASVEAWAYEIAPTERLAGVNRYATSAAFATWAADEGMSFNDAGIATGKSFPDALAGGALCGARGSVLLLADYDGGTQAVELLAEHKDEIMRMYYLGGENSVTSELAELIESSLG